MTVQRQPQQQEGFALIVITALFVAFSLLAAAIIDRSTATQQLDLQNQTRIKLSRISNALVEYYIFNGRHYPCPAPANVLETDVTFGVSISSCDSGGPYSGADLLGASELTIRGMVPIAALSAYGISPSDAFDAWNNRIMYAVDRPMTVAGGTASSALARPVVVEPITGETFHSPDFVLISYGRDGIGAIPRSRTTATISCPSTYTSGREINCGTDLNTFIQMPPHTGSAFDPTATDISAYFDDLLNFYSVQ